MGGPGKSSCSEGSEYVWQRGEGSQKCLVRGNFQSVPCYRKRTDQKPPINRHFWIPTPLWHTYSEPSWHEDSPGPPLPPRKMHPELPRNKYFSSFGQLWVIKSPPYHGHHHHHHHWLREKNRISNVRGALGISPHSSPAGIFCKSYLIFPINKILYLSLYYYLSISISTTEMIIFPSLVIWDEF